MSGIASKESAESVEILDPEARLVPQVPPLYLGTLCLDQEGLKDHQVSLDQQDCQGEMDKREARVIKEIQAREELRDFQVWLEKPEQKERRGTEELVSQALLASLGLLDPRDHAVYHMEQMPWVLGLKTWTATLISSGVLPVHQGLQDLLVQQDPTCHHLTQLQASLQGMLDHPVSLAETGCQANLEYQVQQEKMGFQVYQELWERRVTKGYLGHLDQRVNVGLWVQQGPQGNQGLLVHQGREAHQGPQDPLAPLDHQDPNSL